MPLIRFDATGTDPTYSCFLRFLTSNIAYPELVQAILRPTESGSAEELYVLIRPLKPQEAFATPSGQQPFDVLQKALDLFGGAFADAGEQDFGSGWIRGNLDAFLEAIALVADPSPHTPEEVLLILPDDTGETERIVRQALTFGAHTSNGIRITRGMMSDGAVRSVLHIPKLTSSYPIYLWREHPSISLFYRLDPAFACFVRYGYRYPYPAMADLHSDVKQGRMTLLSVADGHPVWFKFPADVLFHPLAEVADVHLSGNPQTVVWKALTPEGGQRLFNVPIELRRKPFQEPSSDERISQPKSGQQRKERIRSLEAQRNRLDRELAHLKDLEQTGYLCLFEDPFGEAVAQFATQYPLSRLRQFLYLNCGAAGRMHGYHLLIAKEGAGRFDLPGEISERGTVFVRNAEWHAMGVDVYLPEDYRLEPFIGFDNAPQLLRAFESTLAPNEARGKRFIVRPTDGNLIEKIVVPVSDAMDLTDAIAYINPTMRLTAFRTLVSGSIDSQMALFDGLGQTAIAQLTQTKNALYRQFVAYLNNLDEELDKALTDLDTKKQDLEEYDSARRATVAYCKAIRELVRNPGNDLMAFLRKETEQNRALVNQLSTIDYRYTMQFEAYEQQIKQLTLHGSETMQTQLDALLRQMETQARSLQEQVDTLRTELERLQGVPERLKRQLDELSKLQGVVRDYAAVLRRGTLNR